ncbi:hypothetical protein KBD18_01375 [Patescibacteria group bacterium]|nr:hypothetical protein [Patescibacteria group bacterium]
MQLPILQDAAARVRTHDDTFGGPLHSSRDEWSHESGRLIRTAIILTPGGCYWDRGDEHPGCTYCAFRTPIQDATGGQPFLGVDHIEMVRTGLALVADKADKACIFTGGSFAPRDISEDGLCGMIDLIAQHPTVQHLMVESRPELLTKAFIRQCIEQLRGKQLEVAIGFETQDDTIRNGRDTEGLNKGMHRDRFEECVRMLRAVDAIPSVYVMLKPWHRMTEAGAVTECIATIEYVFRTGAKKVLLQATFPQDNSLPLATAWRAGTWTPPTFASIAQVLTKTAHLGPVMLGRFDDVPPPIAIPSGCEMCTAPMTELFEQYRRTLDRGVLTEGPDCHCPNEWKQTHGSTRTG